MGEAVDGISESAHSVEGAVPQGVAGEEAKPDTAFLACGFLNRGHSHVSEDDIRTAVGGHSTDLLRELVYEVRDSLGETAKAIEDFVCCPLTFGRDEIVRRIGAYADAPDEQRKMIDALLWYCFLGVQLQDGTEAYAYEDEYNVDRLLRRARAQSQDEVFVVHPAFRTALHIGSAST